MFRRRVVDPDRLVKKILDYGDIDTSLAPGAERIELLNTEEKRTLESVEVQSAAALKEAMGRVARAKQQRQARINRRNPKLETRTSRRAEMSRWIKAGILERLTIFDAPLPIRWTLMGILAALDYYIFAKAVAVALDIEDSLTNVQFWLAGLFGLGVFVVGIFLGFALKRYWLAHAQASLIEEHAAGSGDGRREKSGADEALPPQTSSGFAFVVFTAFLFITACVVGAFIRLEAGTGERRGAVILQMLIPVVVVLVEFVTNDPTHVRVPRRGPVDWWLDQRLAGAKGEVERIKATSTETKKRIRQTFAAARQKLRVALLDLRFKLEETAS
jgi:hypothetical protein